MNVENPYPPNMPTFYTMPGNKAYRYDGQWIEKDTDGELVIHARYERIDVAERDKELTASEQRETEGNDTTNPGLRSEQ